MIPLTAASAPIHTKEARAGILVPAWGFGFASAVPMLLVALENQVTPALGMLRACTTARTCPSQSHSDKVTGLFQGVFFVVVVFQLVLTG